MLNLEVCKRCWKELSTIKIEDLEGRRKNGGLFCPGKAWGYQTIGLGIEATKVCLGEIPSFCPYVLEHEVSQGSRGSL